MAIVTFNGFSYDPEKQLTKNFRVKNFLVTNTGLSNHPTEAYYKNIVNILAPTMQRLYDEIGPFNVLSAFRSKEVNDAVAESKSPTLSFHEVGLAVDIYPTTMNIETYFGKILNSPYWMGALYEIFLKPPQNAIHLSVSVDNRKGLVKIMNEEKTSYVAATVDQIQKYINDVVGNAGRSIASLFSSGDSDNPEGIPKTAKRVILASTGIMALMFLMTGKKKE
jgi:hypothetical protein